MEGSLLRFSPRGAAKIAGRRARKVAHAYLRSVVQQGHANYPFDIDLMPTRSHFIGQ
jgi:hypothetical protein